MTGPGNGGVCPQMPVLSKAQSCRRKQLDWKAPSAPYFNWFQHESGPAKGGTVTTVYGLNGPWSKSVNTNGKYFMPSVFLRMPRMRGAELGVRVEEDEVAHPPRREQIAARRGPPSRVRIEIDLVRGTELGLDASGIERDLDDSRTTRRERDRGVPGQRDQPERGEIRERCVRSRESRTRFRRDVQGVWRSHARRSVRDAAAPSRRFGGEVTIRSVALPS